METKTGMDSSDQALRNLENKKIKIQHATPVKRIGLLHITKIVKVREQDIKDHTHSNKISIIQDEIRSKTSIPIAAVTNIANSSIKTKTDREKEIECQLVSLKNQVQQLKNNRNPTSIGVANKPVPIKKLVIQSNLLPPKSTSWCPQKNNVTFNSNFEVYIYIYSLVIIFH